MHQQFKIELCNIFKSFIARKKSVDVIKGISLEFKKEKTYALTGASGSGKSTLLHLIAGLDQPTTGSVFINGVSTADLSLTERAKKVGLVFQYPYLINELSVIENVMLAGQLVGMPIKEAHKKAEELLDDVGIAETADWNIGQLSGGQRQRVTLARALINQPDFLIADELTGSVDEQTGKKIIETVFACQKKWKMGLIISTHNNAIACMMEQVYTLKDGVIKMSS